MYVKSAQGRDMAPFLEIGAKGNFFEINPSLVWCN